MNRRAALFFPALASLSIGCVVSTYDPPGSPPDVALPEEPPPPAPDLGPPQIGASHVLVSYQGATRAAPNIKRSKAEARDFAEQILKRAMSGESFATLAKENSDDRGSATQGGELGVFKRDQMVPSFSKAAFALQVGQLSRVVESPFGFHIILRTQ